MELRHLRTFVTLCETLHFRQAAARLGLTQPALSHHLAQLEEHLGVRLLDRSRRHVEVTEAGATFLVSAREALARLELGEQEARRVGRTVGNRLRFGYLEYVNLNFVARALRRLADEAPEVQVESVEMYPSQVLSALSQRTIDVGMTFHPVKALTLASRRVVSGRWVVVLPARHPLARRDEVPLSALADERLILFARKLNPPTYDWFMQQCRASGFVPTIAFHTTQAVLGPTLVAERVGVFLVGSYVLRELPRGVVQRPLSGFDTRLEFALAWRADDRSPALRTFLQLARPDESVQRRRPP
ncbi:MAG: LysR substrate-binding domain-containing protein [Myxococcaceae bacterium]|jgi:DNA-binding transcriptional LysR family regulator|nr:LysR substrate-binding domain-containing protein [Myxococcaceae bacterium]